MRAFKFKEVDGDKRTYFKVPHDDEEEIELLTGTPSQVQALKLGDRIYEARLVATVQEQTVITRQDK